MNTQSPHSRVVVITGASSGIGEATARALAGEGYRLALLARRVHRITALAEELGSDVIAIEADVTDRDSLVAAAASSGRARRRRRPDRQRRRHAARPLQLPTARRVPPDDRGEPARRHHRIRGLPRPAAGRRRRPGQHLLESPRPPPRPTACAAANGVRPAGAAVVLRRTPARSARDGDRTRCRGHRAPHPHHRPPRPSRAQHSSTPPCRSPPKTSPRSSPSPSNAPSTSPSTRSCSDQPVRHNGSDSRSRTPGSQQPGEGQVRRWNGCVR